MAKKTVKALTRKVGKIQVVRFGISLLEPATFGIHFTLGSNPTSVSKGWKHGYSVSTKNRAQEAKLSENAIVKMQREYFDILKYVSTLLEYAKVGSVSELKGIPVEASFDSENSLVSFRILTEVL
jgi:hypothetical protein